MLVELWRTAAAKECGGIEAYLTSKRLPSLDEQRWQAGILEGFRQAERVLIEAAERASHVVNNQ